ncbi:FecR family protein [Sphingobacterium gobiense]|uniref:Iron dicitrate transport regulator FecR n=1 Tax=Sphingobacterium gobiense TaxID=1382456 RepID=A0A2S9JTS7_9SPHI|nr:FecR family protein [Sphingobacterium gobiense]PRD56628.1 iron dicitrate transport regulator FecR [Sphingobacterium gobiense]
MGKSDQNTRMQDLASRWLNGSLSETEQREFDDWFSSSVNTPIFIQEHIASSKEMHCRTLLERVYKEAKIRRRHRRLRVCGAVAAVLLAALVGLYVVYEKVNMNVDSSHFVVLEDVAPGTNKAVLTLADGTVLDLNSDQEGIVIGDEITYTDGRRVLDEHRSSSLMMLNTPKGGQYQIVLSDGSKVWLNAASSLKYPTAFSSEERIIELEGEGYFEVAKDSKRPFKVLCRGQEINVLGTAFNVSAYPGEREVKTTLVRGSLSVSAHHSSVTLKPGEESVYIDNQLYARIADVERTIGWKEGLFRFSHTELKKAMTELSRWYNLDIEYRGAVPTTYFSGEIERNLHLSSVLGILKESGLHFRLELHGSTQKLIIMP